MDSLYDLLTAWDHLNDHERSTVAWVAQRLLERRRPADEPTVDDVIAFLSGVQWIEE